MAFDTPFFDSIETILLFRKDSLMALGALDSLMFTARPLFYADPSFALDESFDRDVALFTFGLPDLPTVVTVFTIFEEGLSVIFPGGMAIGTLHPFSQDVGLV